MESGLTALGRWGFVLPAEALDSELHCVCDAAGKGQDRAVGVLSRTTGKSNCARRQFGALTPVSDERKVGPDLLTWQSGNCPAIRALAM